MARVAGKEIPDNKKVWVGLTYIYGIGRTLSFKILERAGVFPDMRVRELSEEEISKINRAIEEMEIKIEGDLRKGVQDNIRRLIDIRSHRGSRHLASMPVRGQRTRSNARTRKGPRKHRILTRKKR